jgi:hypothetical protein
MTVRARRSGARAVCSRGLVAALVLTDAVEARAARDLVARPELARALQGISNELTDGLAPGASPKLDEREMRRRLSRAEREVVAGGGSGDWLDAFLARQKGATDDAARASLVRDAAGALATIAAEIDSALATRGADRARAERDAAAGRLLAKVLNEEEFRRFPREEPPPGLWQRLLARIVDWWRRLEFPHVPEGAERIGAWIVTALVCAVAAWLVVRVARGRVTVFRPARPSRASRTGAGAADPPAADEETRRIDELLARGAFRDALRALHAATIRRLRAERRLPRTRGLTNWDVLRLLADRDVERGAIERLSALNREFDQAWYGRVAIDPERFGRFQSETESFFHELGSGSTSRSRAASASHAR